MEGCGEFHDAIRYSLPDRPANRRKALTGKDFRRFETRKTVYTFLSSWGMPPSAGPRFSVFWQSLGIPWNLCLILVAVRLLSYTEMLPP